MAGMGFSAAVRPCPAVEYISVLHPVLSRPGEFLLGYQTEGHLCVNGLGVSTVDTSLINRTPGFTTGRDGGYTTTASQQLRWKDTI